MSPTHAVLNLPGVVLALKEAEESVSDIEVAQLAEVEAAHHSPESWADIQEGSEELSQLRRLHEVIAENSIEVCASTDLTYKRCDDVDHTGARKPPGQSRNSWSHAQKMLSAVVYCFGRHYRRGTHDWVEVSSGHFLGNPGRALEVQRYMVALRRRKADAGDTPTRGQSTSAIDPEIIRQLYDYNGDSSWNPDTPRPGQKGYWGGSLHRAAVHTVGVIAFHCLLRIDEVLHLRHEDIWIDEGEPNHIVITLPRRKTHQTGGIPPFHLWKLEAVEDTYLCPVQALAHWVKTSGAKSGYLFRAIGSSNQLKTDNHPIRSERWIEMFRNALVDIKIDPTLYAGHSFRRGGCQYLAFVKKWPIYEICDWGGWSSDFQHGAILRYLFDERGNPGNQRANYMNPNRQVFTVCMHCRRQCGCAGAVMIS
ncbi:DNA breaking-rejoining enzyme [Ephemerocybe angulata]|uniref:DNA breaking-rejoining enzyme n=1 Tax=Ephemerocybe angulata TaxID=980116 RepID=A0A8H6HLA3_9AGAR|nr:DNA breaking-rejoining enzyme [Tulosesus angulatus]